MPGFIQRLTGQVHVGKIGDGSDEVLRDVRRRGGGSSFELASWLVRWLFVLDKSAETGKLGFWSGHSFENAHSKCEELAGFVVDQTRSKWHLMLHVAVWLSNTDCLVDRKSEIEAV
jgi:hypothetical protein